MAVGEEEKHAEGARRVMATTNRSESLQPRIALLIQLPIFGLIMHRSGGPYVVIFPHDLAGFNDAPQLSQAVLVQERLLADHAVLLVPVHI